MSLENFGANGSVPEQLVTYPVRAVARTVPLPRSAAENIRREGIVGGTMDTATGMLGRMTLEAFRMIGGPIGFVLGKTRDAIGTTINHTARIGWQLAKRAPIFPG